MLDLKYVVENADKVKQAMATRSGSYDVDAVVELDNKRKAIIYEVEQLKADKNKISALVAQYKREKKDASEIIEKMKSENDRIKELDAQRT